MCFYLIHDRVWEGFGLGVGLMGRNGLRGGFVLWIGYCIEWIGLVIKEGFV